MKTLATLMQSAVEHHQAGRHAEAEALYGEIHRRAPQNADALHLMGLLFHQKGEQAVALRRIMQAIELRSDIATYHNSLGVVHRALEQTSEAQVSFAKAVELRPSFHEAWANWVGLMAQLADAQGLSQTLDQWVQSCPQSVQARLQRAGHRYLQGDLVGALDDYLVLSKIRKDDLKPLLQAALLCHELGRDEQALDLFGRAQKRFLKDAKLGARIVQSKLNHDIEQMEWLESHFGDALDWKAIHTRFRQVREDLYGSGNGPQEGTVLSSEHQHQIGQWYNRPLHIVAAPSVANGALGNDWNGTEEEERYLQSDPGLIWVDDFLQPEALHRLRQFCMGSTIWTDFEYSGGYVGSNLANGFVNGLLLQIARQLRERMPRVIGPHPLRQMWAYKYDQRLTGIRAHADSAAVNVNFWITPNSANRNPDSGGLVVWRKLVPSTWNFKEINRRPDALMQWTESAGAERVNVPYRANRAVIFNSELVHRTADLEFEPGYENRRINVTMLFGRRGQS